MMANFSWPDGKRLAVSFVVNVEEGAELRVTDGDRSPEPVDELGVVLKGDFRNYGNETNYAYGTGPGAQRVLLLLERFGVTATFTAAGLALERAPHLAKAIAAAGHEACAHGWRWVPQHRFSEAAERAFIRKAVASIEKTVGQRPLGWLSRYLHTGNTRRLLAEEGFLYHMDDYSGDTPFWDASCGKPIVVIPYALDTNDMKMWNAPALSPADWASYAIDSFDWMMREPRSEPGMLSIGVHLRIIGRPGRIGAFERVLDHIAQDPRVWVTTRRAIAEHFMRAVPAPTATS
jgi:peptidoglycan/xylan/chitin deacetylase (PgdA/CDA1 family)